MPFSSMMNDRVTFVKHSGEVIRENIKAVVSANDIHIDDVKLPIEKDDHILRVLPNGFVEDYIVTRPDFNKGFGGIPDFYVLKVRRSNEPVASPQTVIANINGNNSRVYVNSTDNSINVAAEVTPDQLIALLAQIKPNLSALPASDKAAVEKAIAVLEMEVASSTPSQPKIRIALQSIKTVCEGAVGNLIATGILGLIVPLLH